MPAPKTAGDAGVMATGALADIRVIEIGDLVAGPFCTRLLADAGAEVIKIEPPKGDPSRRSGLSPGKQHPDASPLFTYLNSNKLGLTAGLDGPEGRRTFLALAAMADVLVVSGPAGWIDRSGLRRERLSGINPTLVVTCITPFGLTGPRRGYLGDDLIAVSAGGLAFATPGVPDLVRDEEREPPLRADTYAGDFVGGLQAANATLVALAMRAQSGRGYEVDVSQQEAVATTMTWEVAHASYLEPRRRRAETTGAQPNAYLPCKDGYVAVAAFLNDHWRGLAAAMGNPEWAGWEVFANSAERARNWDVLEPLLLEWTRAHTGEEIAAIAQRNGVPCFPAYSIGQMMRSPHVRSRGYLQPVRLRDGDTLELPGFPVRMERTPWTRRREAPACGEDTERVLREWLGHARWARATRGGAHDDVTRAPLAGIRVLDLGQMIAVPSTTQALAWLGAEVLVVENVRRLGNRDLPPFADGIRGVNRSGGFNLLNTNKLSITLDLSKPEGLRIAKRLAALSDVVTENFSTGTMEKLGLDYASIRAVKPDIIYLSLAAFGRSGPLKDFAGFHSVINLFSGLAAVTGYAGGHPRILGGFFPDFFSGCYCLLAMLEALRHRAITGEGQYIEVAMTEVLTALVPEAVAEHSLSGKEPERVGNRHRYKAPHNVYRCRGDQQWVAISASDDETWRALCKAIGYGKGPADQRFSDQQGRWRNQEALDEVIRSWTVERSAEEAAEWLQRAGVPASPVLNAGQLLTDPHLVERGFVTRVQHPETGTRPMGTTAWRIDGARPPAYRAAPRLGEHNRYVLGDLLQMPDAEIRRLDARGVLGAAP